MKRETVYTGSLGAALAAWMSLGLIHALITGFDLTILRPWLPQAVCLMSAVFGGFAYSRKRGGLWILAAAALTAGYLWRQGDILEQLLRLIYRVSYLYNRAYHFGYLQLVEGAWNEGIADLPVALFGALAALSVSWSVCKGTGLTLPGLAVGLPLAACFVVTDTVPSEAGLFAVLLGFAMLLLTARVRASSQDQANRLTVCIFLPVAAAVAGLFLAVPKDAYVNQTNRVWERLAQLLPTQEQVTELAQIHWKPPVNEGETVDLASLNGQPESETPVMTVQADVGGALYLRGQDYDEYTGLGWASTPHRAEDFSGPGENLGIVSVRTESRLDRLYLPYYPRPGLSLVEGQVENTQLYTAYHFQRGGLPDDLDNLLAQSPEPDASPRHAYLALPEDTRGFAAELLEQIPLDRSTATSQARSIAAYVRQVAAYDRQTPRMPEGEQDFVRWFLTQSDRGYCVHFATAAVVLLRAAGIEARYVSGYMARVSSGEPTAVTVSNAHAWAEYWEPRLGIWMPLEATPAVNGGALPMPQQIAAPAPTRSTAPEPSEPATVPATTALPSQQATEPAAPPPPAKSAPAFIRWMLAMIALIVFLECQRAVRRASRRRRQRTGNANAQAIARWQEVKSLARALKEAPPEALELLTGKAKFSQHTLTREELSAYDAYLRDARTRAGKTGILRKLYCRYGLAVI